VPSLPDPASDPPHPSRAPRRAVVVAGVFVAIALALRALLPVALEAALPWAAHRWGGVRLEVENIDLGLLRGWVRVAGLRVALPAAADPQPRIDPDTALLRFDELDLSLRWSGLLSRRLQLERVAIDGLRGRLQQRPDGSFELPRPGEAQPPPESPSPQEPGWEIALDRLELRDLGFALTSVAAGKEVLGFSFDELVLDGLATSDAGTALGRLALQRPQLRVSQDWLFAPAPVAAPAAQAPPRAPPGEAPPAADAGAPGFAIDHIAIESAGFGVETERGAIEAALRLEASDVSLAPGAVFPLQIELTFETGRLGVDGRLGIAPVFFEGGVEWSDLRVPPLVAALRPQLLPWIRSCAASGRVELALHSAEAPGVLPGITLTGAFQTEDLALADPQGDDLSIAWQRSETALREIWLPLGGTAAPRIDIERIALTEPRVAVARPSTSLERLQAAASGAPEGGAEPEGGEPEPGQGAETRAETGPGVAVRIGELVVERGAAQLGDRSVTPAHETRLADLAVDVRGLAWPERDLEELRLDARVQDTASVSLRGALAAGDGRVELDLSDLELVPYDGFARRAGWHIGAGRASLETELRLRGERVDADNALVLHDLDVGSDDPNAFTRQVGLPLDVALALLRDPKGNIALAIPVTRRAGQIGVGLAAILRNALLTAIKGALSSPFKLLGAAIPTGAVQAASFELVPFAPGSSEVDAEVRARVEPIARLLTARPKLALVLAGRTAPEDAGPLAEQRLRERAAAGEGLPHVGAGGFFARRRVVSALRERAAGETGELAPEDQTLLERTVAAQPVSDAQRRDLANARAEALRDALVDAGAPAEALRLGDPSEAAQAGVALALGTRSARE